jgi:hypothetical protein
MNGTRCRTIGALLAASLLLTFAGCSSAPTDGPQQSIEQFYQHLGDGNYRGAMSLYSAEARKVLEDPDTASDAGFAEWAELETKNNTVDAIDVIQQEDEDPARSSVEYRVVYRDGSTVDRKVTMTLEDGQWKLGLIG